jgi:uncharacterized membrane protein YgaE (UPF0421/DUF939 family)
VTLAAIAAALAWLLAHRVLGHKQPFFAPIAAAITLSSSRIQRSRRIIQMMGGVLLGIAIGDALGTALGTSTATVALIVFVTMAVAVGLGIGFVGEGMMFVNQAASSAILVVTVHRAGTGGERAIDAILGGAVALVLGVGLFPAQPVRLLEDAERSAFSELSKALEQLAEMLSERSQPPEQWAQRTGYEIHQRLSALARARATARVNVRVAPRRWHLRGRIDAEDQRVSHLDLLGNTVISLSRAAIAERQRQLEIPDALQDQVVALGRVIGELAIAPRPWPSVLIRDVARTSERAVAEGNAQRYGQSPVLGAILAALAGDLANVAGESAQPAGEPAQVPGTRSEVAG